MNLEKMIALTAMHGFTYPYQMAMRNMKGVVRIKHHKPEPCKTDAAYIAAEAKRQKRIQRNIGVTK